MSKFQIVFIALFVLFILGGLTAFALFKGDASQQALAKITMWGTVPNETFVGYINTINASLKQPIDISYVEIEPADFDNRFIQALARGEGPDAVLLPLEMMLKHEDKLLPIPYDTISVRDYMNTFVEESELYLGNDGALGFPLIIDPLVMYWNRDLFRSASIATPPVTWGDFDTIIPKLTKKDLASNIQKSTIALGEYRNLTNAREVLSTIFFQAGNPITQRSGPEVISLLGRGGQPGLEDSVVALDFFTSYTNPTAPEYSWNRSLPESRSFFMAGKLATYFGFASEIRDIQDKNPNLNFDVAPFPQRVKADVRTTYGKMYGMSIVKQSQYPNDAYSVMQQLISAESLAQLQNITYLPPVRRDLIAQGTSDPFLSIFYDSALISQGWLDPDSFSTDSLFQAVTEAVTSGLLSTRDALRKGQGQLEILLGSR